MALSSMTGFARGQGVAGAYAWSWEIKSVNAKGLDLRLRLPPGWDAVEVPARLRATEKLSRGTVYANLTVERKGVQPTVKVNEPVLNAVLATLKSLAGKVDAASSILPLVAGMLLGNLDREMRNFLGRAVPVMIPFFALGLGASLDLHKVWQAGLVTGLTSLAKPRHNATCSCRSGDRLRST